MLAYRRGKSRVIADYSFDDIYKYYKSLYKDKSYLSKKQVKALYKEVFTEIAKMIVLDNLQFRLPANLGYLRIKKKYVEPTINENGELDTRRLSIDWKATKKLWQERYPGMSSEELKKIKNKPVIRELNEHTDGYRYVWYWEKLTSTVPNQTAYYIDMTRTNDQILSRASKVNHLNFFE
jgi:hypothetical protein